MISVKRSQEEIPGSSVVAELKPGLTQLSQRSSINNEWGGYKRSGRRCLPGHVYSCFPKNSGGR